MMAWNSAPRLAEEWCGRLCLPNLELTQKMCMKMPKLRNSRGGIEPPSSRQAGALSIRPPLTTTTKTQCLTGCKVTYETLLALLYDQFDLRRRKLDLRRLMKPATGSDPVDICGGDGGGLLRTALASASGETFVDCQSCWKLSS